MMSVLEYALDINKTVEEVLKKCKDLSIDARVEDDLLNDEDITILDGYFANEDVVEELDEIVEEIVDNKKINVDNTISKQKLKKKCIRIKKNYNQIKILLMKISYYIKKI